MIIRKHFNSLLEALEYFREEAYYQENVAEEGVDRIMECVDIYKYLYSAYHSKRYNPATKEHPVFNYRLMLADLHQTLRERIDLVQKTIRDYYRALLKESAMADEEYDKLVEIYKNIIDKNMYAIQILFNRIRVVRKIMNDNGQEVPPIPKDTLREMVQIFRNYPTDMLTHYIDIDGGIKNVTDRVAVVVVHS